MKSVPHHIIQGVGDRLYQLLKRGQSLSMAVKSAGQWATSQGSEMSTDDLLNIAQEQMSQLSNNVPIKSQVSPNESQSVPNVSTVPSIRNVAADVRDWVLEYPGVFTMQILSQELGLGRKDYDAARKALYRLHEEGAVKKSRGRRGHYRAVDTSVSDRMDLSGASTGRVPIGFPLDVHELVTIHEKDVVLVAGEPNSGKTAFAMNIVWRVIQNASKSQKSQSSQPLYKEKEEDIIHYFSSEAGPSEIKNRILRFGESTPVQGLDVLSAFNQYAAFYERNYGFADKVAPAGVNLIDFLEVFDGEYYKIGGDITEIHGALTTGIAVICIQQAQGGSLPRGGSAALEKPRLAVSLSEDKERGFCTCKILKAKHFNGRNPNGLERDYVISNGVFFTPVSDWGYKRDLEPKRSKLGYVARALNYASALKAS